MRQQSFSGRVRNFANYGKPQIDIDLDGTGLIKTYSTYDKIQGTVTITPPSDTSFDNIEVSFVGNTRVWVDRVSPSAAISARTEAFQQFLKQDQPIDEEAYPAARILLAGKVYKFPFTFTVPDALPESCRHKTVNTKIKELHLRLPPSLGDPDVAGHGQTLLDDCAPEMARISYGVRTRIHRQKDEADKEIIIAEKTRKVRIIPAYEEAPPVQIDDDEEYCSRREKNIRKGLLKAKTGRLAMEAAQPKSWTLPAPSANHAGSLTTMTTVRLRFDPASDAVEPPRLGQLSTKVRVGTFYASSPRAGFPSQKAQVHDHTQGLYVEALPLASRNMSATQWQRHEAGTSQSDATIRRSSAISIHGACPAPTESHHANLPFYTAEMLIPLELPSNKSMLPTFHSCIVSRVYVLELSLGLPPLANSVALKLPVQVASETASLPDPTGDHLSTVDELDELGLSTSHEMELRRGSAPAYVDRAGVGRAMRNAQRRRSLQVARQTHAAPPPPPQYSFFAPRTGGVLPNENNSPLYQSLPLVR